VGTCSLAERFALERRVQKDSVAIRSEHKIDRSIAQSADSVEKKYVSIAHQSGWTNQVRIPFSIEEPSCVSYDAGFQNGPANIEAVPLRINDSAGYGYGLQPSAPSVKRSK
jgi:hypothetical protein